MEEALESPSIGCQRQRAERAPASHVAEHCHSSPSSWWQQGLPEEVIIGLWHQGTIPRRLQCRKSHFFTFLAHHNKQNKHNIKKKQRAQAVESQTQEQDRSG